MGQTDKEAAAKAALSAKCRAEADAALQAKIDQARRDVPPGIAVTDAAEVKNSIRNKANVWAKLLYVQTRLRVAKNRGKGHTPNAQVTYEYRNAEDILVAAKPLCDDVGAVVTLNVLPMVVGENTPIDVRVVRLANRDAKGNIVSAPTFARAFGPRFVALATATFTDCLTGNAVTCSSFAEIDFWRKGQTEPEKLCGSADSYASKYALGHLFALDNNRDADQESDEGGKEPW